MMKHFLAVAGNIGVGKSTFAKMLAERFQAKLFCEQYVDNPYLKDFYENMKKWSFHSQIFFLIHNFRTHFQIQNSEEPSVQDRTIYEDSEIFAVNLFHQGLMSHRDYQCYQALYSALLPLLRYPDLIIYLRASVETLLTRIQRRRRHFEQPISSTYLQQLNQAYDVWATTMKNNTQLFTIETDSFDPFSDKATLEMIFQNISQLC